MEKTFTRFSVLFILIFSCAKSGFAQDTLPFTDSASFFQFLEKQQQIPSFKYRYKAVPKTGENILLEDSILNFSEGSGDTLISKSFDDFRSWFQAGNSYLNQDSLGIQPAFLIYDVSFDLNAAQAYVANLWRNKDIFLPEESPEVGEDLVILANLVPYESTVKRRFRFFSDYKLVIVVSLIGFFLVMAIGMILFMVHIKSRHSRREALKAEYENQIIGPLSELLFEKSEEDIDALTQADIHGIFPEKDFRKELFKSVLIEKIISLNKQMKGDFKDKLKALYKKFELDAISINKLNSKRWDRVTNGLVHINEMDLVEALPMVRELTDSPNFYIRSQSIATLLNLSEKVDLTTIKKQPFPLSRWQQMNYLRIIKYLHIQKSLKIDTLFSAQNQSIRLFGYKLVRMLGRVDLLEQLSELAPEVEDIEKIEILKTYQIIGVHTEAAFVNNCLRSENIALVKAAARAASSIGDQASAHILIELLEEKPSFELKMIYMDTLKNLDQTMYNAFVSQSEDEELSQINDHLQDPLLQNV